MQESTLNDSSTNKPPSKLLNRGILLVLSSNFLGKTFIIDKPQTTIGRLEECDIHIQDPLISKKHCIINIDEEGKFSIEDLDSTNSTYINEKKIKKDVKLIYGDRIIIGNTIMRFYLEEKIK